MMREFAKTTLHRAGLLSAVSRWRNSDTLTVAMFHRVLPAAHPEWKTADARWTVTAETFERCLEVFQGEFQPVSLGQVAAARSSLARLPRNSLLVSFDDGWRDTMEFACPILQKRKVPAVVFVVAAAAGADIWQETLLEYWRHGRLAEAWPPLWKAVGQPAPASTERNAQQLMVELARLAANARDGLLSRMLGEAWSGRRPRMAEAGEWRRVAGPEIEIASHGMTHVPIPLAADRRLEIEGSRKAIESMTGRPARALSFPHGRYDESALGACREAGYELLFSSDPWLNEVVDGSPSSAVLGRVNIQENSAADAGGRFQAARLLSWLAFQPHGAAWKEAV